ncbi:MAG: DUF4126 domain-containing protein [Verrucomicrobia bacterium]|nr:DUF4126 domain-containing protein [Verrucomicrobiota bacterium]
METLLGLCVGVGLSAACGFRVFVPLLITSIASYSGHLTLAPSFDWIASPAAIAAFSVATLLEVGAYYVPWLDNFLDTVATPAAIVAGTIVTASFVSDVSPFLRWTLAVVAGGGMAGVIQASTVVLRGISTGSTGGLANPVFATAELGGSIFTSLGALTIPLVMLLLIGTALAVLGKKIHRIRSQKVAN